MRPGFDLAIAIANLSPDPLARPRAEGKSTSVDAGTGFRITNIHHTYTGVTILISKDVPAPKLYLFFRYVSTEPNIQKPKNTQTICSPSSKKDSCPGANVRIAKRAAHVRPMTITPCLL